MSVESGPASKDRNYEILRTVVFLGFALYFLYDGAIGYPNENQKTAEQALQAPEPFAGEITFDQLGEEPCKSTFAKLVESNPTTLQQVHNELGEPTLIRQGKDPSAPKNEYFVSRYGYAKVEVRGDRVRVTERNWKPWGKTKADIHGQYYWAIVPAIPGLYFLWRALKAATLRVVVDDNGLTYASRKIPFDQMVSLREYNPKGWIDLYYQATGSREKRLRLDDQKIALFDDVVAAICQAKGFKNEVQAYAEEKEREEEQEQEDDS